MASAADTGPVPAASTTGTLAGILARAVRNRGALAGLELREARSRAALIAVLAGTAAACALLAGLALTLLVAAIFWDTPQRVAALAWLAGIEITLMLAAALRVRRHLRSFRLFSDTRAILEADLRCLRDMVGRFMA